MFMTGRDGQSTSHGKTENNPTSCNSGCAKPEKTELNYLCMTNKKSLSMFIF